MQSGFYIKNKLNINRLKYGLFESILFSYYFHDVATIGVISFIGFGLLQRQDCLAGQVT